jgi:hypothetical protein
MILVFVFLQHFSGVMAIFSYAEQICVETASSSDPSLIAMNLRGSPVTDQHFWLSVICRFGRRSLLLVFTSLSLSIQGFYFRFTLNHYERRSSKYWTPFLLPLSIL